ncbi:hypothetical protein PoB_003169800 [Plakobranchus ocellatus]|uniref:Uncharacterized protein n=1 Tax=Plakobranchus ocellatus TaxID=259542 RepID=A0AAV4AEG1_9GAST|nr:hypothetical protein PoB_003169800 [Plakobranchus ocellatus]
MLCHREQVKVLCMSRLSSSLLAAMQSEFEPSWNAVVQPLFFSSRYLNYVEGFLISFMSICFNRLFNPQQGDPRLSGAQSGQGVGRGARTCDRRVPANLRVDSLATVPPMRSAAP